MASATTRTGGEGPRLEDDQPVPHARSFDQNDLAELPRLTAVISVAGLPHGWDLLLLLEIARE